MIYDIAIIGLGPSGSTLARLLSPNFKVVAIDRKRLDGSLGGFKKSCGGLLAPSAQKALLKAGLNLPSSILVDPQIFAVKTMDLSTSINRFYQKYFLNISRHKFDLWLASLIPSSVKIFDQAQCSEIKMKNEEVFDISFIQGGQKWTISAKNIVGADGSASITRRFIKAPPIRRYLCIQETYPGKYGELYGCFFHPDITDCYGWINNKNGQQILGAALPLDGRKGKSPRERFEAAKEALNPLAYRFYGLPLHTDAALVSRPSSLGEIFTGSDKLFLTGEAAGLVSPSSLEGISYALLSAISLSQVFNSHSKNPQDQYKRAIWPLKRNIALRLLKSPFIYNPFLRRLIMQSGLKSVELDSINEFG